jgi:aminoglycoside 6'-N-acetyltransferase I
MKIRKATKKDLKQISKIVKNEFDRIFKEKWSNSTSIQFVNYFYKIGIIYVAEDKQKVLGFIIGRLEPIGEGIAMVVEGLAVDSKHQKKGIGSLLIKKLEEYSKSKKVYLTYLTTRKNIPAVKFYEKMKFKKSKDVVILGKKLR